MLVTTQPEGNPEQAPRAVAAATARLLRDIMGKGACGASAGGGQRDTSTLAIHALDIWGLSYRAEMVPGAPLSRAHSHALRWTDSRSWAARWVREFSLASR